MSLPCISVITPSFNSAKTIRETIESVKAQEYPHTEHIVIDGGSKDGTLEILREYPHLTWISEKDEGHYHAMNKGIQRCQGAVVAILNADDCYRPGALRKVGESFQAHSDWDGLFTDVVYVDGRNQPIFSRMEGCFDYDVLRFGRVCYVIHPTLFLRKAVYDQLGGYKHKEFLNCCDVELILRLGQSRRRIGHIPEFLVNYRIHEYGQSADLRVVRNMAQGTRKSGRSTAAPPVFWGRWRPFMPAGYASGKSCAIAAHAISSQAVGGSRSICAPRLLFSSNIGIDTLKS